MSRCKLLWLRRYLQWYYVGHVSSEYYRSLKHDCLDKGRNWTYGLIRHDRKVNFVMFKRNVIKTRF